MSISSLKQGLNLAPLTLAQTSFMPKQNEFSLDELRSQMIGEESGIVSGSESDVEAQKILQLIKDYEGVAPERLNHVRSELIKISSGGTDEYPIDFCKLTIEIINDYIGFDEVQADTIKT